MSKENIGTGVLIVCVVLLIVTAVYLLKRRYGRSAVEKSEPGSIVARLRGFPATAEGSGLFGFLLAIGAVLMLLEVIGDTSAVRIAAYGAVWTGWNVLWGLAMLNDTIRNSRTDYTVYRARPDDGGE